MNELPDRLRKGADAIEDEIVLLKLSIGGAADCAAPLMREAAEALQTYEFRIREAESNLREARQELRELKRGDHA